MLKFSQSAIHTQYNFAFFGGGTPAPGGQYMFEETEKLFAKENLGPNLMEYSQEMPLPFNINEEPISVILGVLPRDPERFLNVVDARIHKSDYEIEVYCDPNYLDQSSRDMLLDVLNNYLGFKTCFHTSLKFDPCIVGLDSKEHRYLQIALSEECLSSRSDKRSDKFQAWSMPGRYVDTSVIFFFVMTCLSGTARKVYE